MKYTLWKASIPIACTCQPEYIFHRIDKKDTIEEFNKSLKQTWLKNRHAA